APGRVERTQRWEGSSSIVANDRRPERDRSSVAGVPQEGSERMSDRLSRGGLLEPKASADSGYLHRPAPFSLVRREGLWRHALLPRMLALAALAAVLAASVALGISADGRVHYALWSAVF